MLFFISISNVSYRIADGSSRYLPLILQSRGAAAIAPFSIAAVAFKAVVLLRP